MRTEDFLNRIKNERKLDPKRLDDLRARLPLGEYADGEFVLSHLETDSERFQHTCVSGAMRAEFISRLLLTLSDLYSKEEATFMIVSPNFYYGRLMNLTKACILVPMVVDEGDVAAALDTVRKISEDRKGKKSGAKLFLVLDGLELMQPISSERGQEDLACYRPFFEAVGSSGIEVITGVDLSKTIFAGYPAAFVGLGNCLVVPSVGGEMDVTHVGADGMMTTPKKATYPSLPTLAECIEKRNAE